MVKRGAGNKRTRCGKDERKMRRHRKFQIKKDGNMRKSKENKETQKWKNKEVGKCGQQGRRGEKLEQKKMQ